MNVAIDCERVHYDCPGNYFHIYQVLLKFVRNALVGSAVSTRVVMESDLRTPLLQDAPDDGLQLKIEAKRILHIGWPVGMSSFCRMLSKTDHVFSFRATPAQIEKHHHDQ